MQNCRPFLDPSASLGTALSQLVEFTALRELFNLDCDIPRERLVRADVDLAHLFPHPGSTIR